MLCLLSASNLGTPLCPIAFLLIGALAAMLALATAHWTHVRHLGSPLMAPGIWGHVGRNLLNPLGGEQFDIFFLFLTFILRKSACQVKF